MIVTLFGKAALKQLDGPQMHGPKVQKLFEISDNASCYQGNYLPQAPYQLFKEQDIMLVIYDYNEPSMGKDQCNRECDGFKTIPKRLNVDSANDIFIALNQTKGMKNTKWFLSGDTIPNVCSYYSIIFFDDYIKLWKYLDIGEGIAVPHGNANFVSREIIKKPFQSRDGNLVFDKKLER